MDPVLQSLLAGLPTLVLHFAVTLAMLAAGVAVYHLITPYHEFRLIRDGNVAAATSLSGAVIGLALPLAACMANSVGVWDIVVWGVVALVIQLVAHRVGDALVRDLPRRIESGEMGAAVLVVAIKLATSLVNAAAVAG